MRLCIPALMILTLSACSNRAVYEAVQENRQAECQKLVGRQRDDCLAEYDMSYDDYQRQRATK